MKTLRQRYQELEAQGLSDKQRRVIEHELELAERSGDPSLAHLHGPTPQVRPLYSYADPEMLHQANPSPLMSLVAAQSLDHLLQRDLQREKDGFPRKIRIGKLVKPGRDGDDKVVVIPTTVEEKLVHDRIPEDDEEGEGGEGQDPGEGGAGEGEEGEVIGEQPVREQQGGGSGSGQGQGGATNSNPRSMILAACSPNSLPCPTCATRARSVHSPALLMISPIKIAALARSSTKRQPCVRCCKPTSPWVGSRPAHHRMRAA